ncbi:Maf family protein [Acetivibrio ethanolgignens]|uniref:dTTP/UTP pyrophosphatase n=1 Tax=Acetivibrio ethanolgignens TaxID=290052 RepID=A0A0V8QHR5_9FIRM|nr:Maf family protein [Acetivibrio ethanolgignens]KSV60014.1 septum formation inhibitor Maf [Acetivibrio ethanolgignens]
MKIILASASPRRRELMDLVELPYEVIPSTREEVITSTIPADVVRELSLMKAEDVAEKALLGEEELALVIGADTVVACDNEILGKPKNEENAKEMLRKLAGRSHSVFTGIALLWIKDGKIVKTVNKAVETKVLVEAMSEEEIAAYVATGEPMDKAGAYAIQGKFAPYISGIEGDYYNVVGFPICTVRKEIRKEVEI